MIFKAYQPLTDKWFLYDNICLAKTCYLKGLPNKPHDPEAFVNLLAEGSSQDGIAQVDLIFKGDPVRTIVFKSGEGFLMNDDGKTIERL